MAVCVVDFGYGGVGLSRLERTEVFSHESYSAAMAALRANKRARCEHLVTWDAGDGWRGEGYYCSRRNRIVTCARSIKNPMMVIF